jgi:hypothetical protein
MLDLTDKQAEIIKVFIEQYRDKSNKISQGISADELEKYGIVSKTFRNHKDYFLKNYFLRLNVVGYHGPRNYLYFQVTQLGVLAYLKWFTNSNSIKIKIDQNFFPFLYKYWEELVENFEEVLFGVLKKTLDRIEIRPMFEGKINGETIYGGKLDESIIIPMEMVEVKIFRKYKQPVIQENPKKDKLNRTDTFDSLNQEIDDKITERFTFLLFFNLLHLSTNAGELVNTYMQNYIEYDKNNATKQSEEEIKSIYTKYANRTLENVTKLFSIINQDKILHDLMKSSISEITEMLADRKTIQTIYEKLD